MLRAVVIALAAVAIAAGGVAAGTSGPNVRGVLDRSGAVSASCPPGDPCDPPSVGLFVVFSRARHTPVRVRVRSDGSFAVRLAPAWYRISLAPPPLAGHVTPRSVRAPRRGVARLRLEIRN